MAIRPQSQRNSSKSQGRGAKAAQGHTTHNKNALKHDHDAQAAANPGAQQDQFGSRHNADNIKDEQHRKAPPANRSNLAARESAQDIQPDRGAANKKGTGRRTRKSGSA